MKDFKEELGEILGENKPKKGRPTTQKKQINKSSEEGTKAGEIRATFIVHQDQLDTLKAIAYHERLMIKEALESALNLFIKTYEKKNGTIYLQTKKPIL